MTNIISQPITYREHARLIAKAVKNWLEYHHPERRQAITKTVSETAFSKQDVTFQIRHLKDSVRLEVMEQWLEEAGYRLDDYLPQKPPAMLALHAGNLPLAGFQDVIAILLSGARYTGKISRKDPFLLPTFLQEVSRNCSYISAEWATQLEQLSGGHHGIMFTGSEDSIPLVRQRVEELELIQKQAKWLVRRAHFSMAYIERLETFTFQDLAEAILRYDGKGCRSVSVIVAPFGLNSKFCTLAEKLENYIKTHGKKAAISQKTEYQRALNVALGRSHVLAGHLLIQETEWPDVSNSDVIHWIVGDRTMARRISETLGEQVQSVYVSGSDKLNGFSKPAEPLHKAQMPDLNWKPDGKDTLRWIREQILASKYT